jgi:NAD(P)H-dependent FMN reductase
MTESQPLTTDPLNILIFLGSVRESIPPKPARLGMRVANACKRSLDNRDMTCALVDPLEIELEAVFKPHFAYAKQSAPVALDTLANQIQAADGYVMVSPEYNHCMSPALTNLLNHFGSSLFSYKPSAIVTYSAGQWGGARAAVNMRTFLAELGCLPVSAMVHIPHAADVFAESGAYLAGVDPLAWDSYLDRTFDQLAWWAQAAQRQRQSQSIQVPPALKRDPSQRNAPTTR